MQASAWTEPAGEPGLLFARPAPEPERAGGALPAGGAALPRPPGDGAAVREEGLSAQVARARTGDAEAFGALYRRHRADVERLCRRLLGEEAAAEDAAADAFLRARERIAAYDAARPFPPWLLAIAANRCLDGLRRRSREARLFAEGVEAEEVAPAAPGERGPTPLRRMLRAEERAALLRAVDALPAKYRLPLVLRHFAELDYATIGAELGVSRNQVGTLLLRARRRLREELGGTRA